MGPLPLSLSLRPWGLSGTQSLVMMKKKKKSTHPGTTAPWPLCQGSHSYLHVSVKKSLGNSINAALADCPLEGGLGWGTVRWARRKLPP